MAEEKKALQLASVASMIDQFIIPNIEILQSLGYKVDVVADFTNPGTITDERCKDLKKRLSERNVRVFDIAIPRSLNLGAIYDSYRQVKELLTREKYTLLHCHSPIGGVIARQAAKNYRKNGLKVIYTAHGFHFYDGAPKKNWLIYYPVEKYYSRFTDTLITINKEDFKRAEKRFKAKKIVYVPGIGVDTTKFKADEKGRTRIRTELGLDDDQTMLLSVGELNKNKNHESVIRALEGMRITYVIVGKGDLKSKLESEAKKRRVDLRLMGFRTDVAHFYNAADIYILPSVREGLNVSLIEAMSCRLPCAVSRIRGNVDLIDEPVFDPMNNKAIKYAIEYALDNRERLSNCNREKSLLFDSRYVRIITERIYKEVFLEEH